MTKKEFLSQLREELSSLPRREREEQLRFYGELIDDRIEDGWSEKSAVSRLGAPDRLAARILREGNDEKGKRSKPKQKHSGGWMITLLILGSPLWISLLVAFFAVILSLAVSIWAVMLSLYAVSIGCIVGGIGGIAGGLLLCFCQHLTGIALLGCGMVCLGIGILTVMGCLALTKGVLRLTQKLFLLFILPFRRKEIAV